MFGANNMLAESAIMSLESRCLIDCPLALGEGVRIVKMPLNEVEKDVADFQGSIYLVVNLLNVLFASAKVPVNFPKP